jgi:hypothetical protein
VTTLSGGLGGWLDHGWGVPPVFGENPTRVFLTALVVEAAPPWEVGLGLLVVELIFTYVCVSLYQ